MPILTKRPDKIPLGVYIHVPTWLSLWESWQKSLIFD